MRTVVRQTESPPRMAANGEPTRGARLGAPGRGESAAAAAVTPGFLRVSSRQRPAVGLPGRMITLQKLAHRGWQTLARTRTSTNGRYRLRFHAERTGGEVLRLRFAGDAADAESHRRLGRLEVYRLVGASWYGGGGSLACGGSLTDSTLGGA